ncbi:MAG: nucleotidyltransferase family protein, partial [Casimicrobium sp.]
MSIDICAMILAAGRGERMRPLTDTIPKPLIVVRGKPLIVHHIEKLVAIGVQRIVINVSYRAEQIKDALGDGSRFGCEILYSYEAEPLETGGGVANASALFDNPQLILASADVYSDIDYNDFIRYRPIKLGDGQWSSSAFFFMIPKSEIAPGGEFSLSDNGLLNEGAPRHTLANIMLLNTELVQRWPRGERFALVPHYREWIAAGRVLGKLHTGLWRNVTNVAD